MCVCPYSHFIVQLIIIHITIVHWSNLTFVWWLWLTKVCLWASKISKICVFGHPTWRITFWKPNFENFLDILWYQFFSMSNTSFCFMPHHARVSCLIIGLTMNAIAVAITVKGQYWDHTKNILVSGLPGNEKNFQLGGQKKKFFTFSEDPALPIIAYF